ncbi:enoyl-[acyl-carrier-protein] reductase FabV [Streptomyces sp. NPDC097619]|uniref:enoyl-[acyl-carrier-protein] reductase FabV n=1 Tax=Streptomyces sp. NPDC097619 TaxID=3157228 RepID=UPI00332FF36F
MTERVITPRSRGFLFLDAHPGGCERLVEEMWRSVPTPDTEPVARPDGAPVALVIGSSAGYGLAATVAGLARVGIRGIGVCFEKAPGRRTGTAGWYRTAATARLAREHGRDFVFVNGDAFTDEVKERVAELVAERFGGRVDHLVYSVAAPRRTDTDTGEVYASVLKPIGAAHTTKTLVFDADAAPEVKEVTTEPAEGDDVARTTAVMGGADWRRWVEFLERRNLLAEGFGTVALSYIGSPLTAALYRQGTIGAAKAHLEETARSLDERLSKSVGGRALTSVNAAAVTQSSTAIPGIALYVGLLRGVLGEEMVAPVDQAVELWDRLTGARPLVRDEEGRVRLDGWELDPAVQKAVGERWARATSANVAGLADLDWFGDEVRRLYGFAVPGVDYGAAVEVDVAWPESAR